jgi:hypothetical protein
MDAIDCEEGGMVFGNGAETRDAWGGGTGNRRKQNRDCDHGQPDRRRSVI